jgi:hypothetical protein
MFLMLRKVCWCPSVSKITGIQLDNANHINRSEEGGRKAIDDAEEVGTGVVQ